MSDHETMIKWGAQALGENQYGFPRGHRISATKRMSGSLLWTCWNKGTCQHFNNLNDALNLVVGGEATWTSDQEYKCKVKLVGVLSFNRQCVATAAFEVRWYERKDSTFYDRVSVESSDPEEVAFAQEFLNDPGLGPIILDWLAQQTESIGEMAKLLTKLS